MHHPQATLQPIPRTVFPQAGDIFGVTLESYNKTQVTNEQSCPKRHSAHMSADVIDNVTLSNRSLNRILHFGFMLAPPDERLSRKIEMHPHSGGQAGLNPNPNLGLAEEMGFDPSLESVEPASYEG